MDFVAIDFETANSSRSSACALGIVVVENNEIVNTMHYYIKPEPFIFDPINIKIHGINEDKCRNALSFKDLWPVLFSFVNNKIVIAHNLSFDKSVLTANLEQYELSTPNYTGICTYKFSKETVPELEGHTLPVMCDFFNIKLNHHDAMEDAVAAAKIYMELVNFDGSPANPKNYNYLANKQNDKNTNSIFTSVLTKPAEVQRAFNTLKGLVGGITADGIITEDESNELRNWCSLHSHLRDKHPFKEIIPFINEIYSDGEISSDELADLIWLCNNTINTENEYYNVITCGIHNLQGILHGILSDNFISDKEIYMLKKWIECNKYLEHSYPFDEIVSLISNVLADGIVDDEEHLSLKAFFSLFIDTKSSFNININEMDELRNKYSTIGICAKDPEVVFNGRLFCFTGESGCMTRNEIASVIEQCGGQFKNSIIKKTNYLVVGNEGNPCWAFSCYGRKIEQAISMRKEGNPLLIVHENDFWKYANPFLSVKEA